MEQIQHRAFEIDPQEFQNETTNLNPDSVLATSLPKDVWGVILEYLSVYDIIFVRASCSWLFKFCKALRPFPKFFVLDQGKMATDLTKHGFVSCLDYVKTTLHFDLTQDLCSVAISSGQVVALEYLLDHGLTMPEHPVIDCTTGTCSIAMLKHLREKRGVEWDVTPPQYSAIIGSMENMARHGHVECMKYALGHGNTQRKINYTPSIACLDLAIRHKFDWTYGPPGIRSKNICEEAAMRSDLTMLQYAHKKGAPLKESVFMAAKHGHIDCMTFATENKKLPPLDKCPTAEAKTLDCFKYLAQVYGMPQLKKQSYLWWLQVYVGNLDILRFMHENKFPLPTGTVGLNSIMNAVVTRSVDIFKFFLDEVKLPFDTIDVYVACARAGNLENLKLAFERDLNTSYQLNDLIQKMLVNAIITRLLDTVKFIWETLPNKEGVDLEDCWNTAVSHGTVEILDYFTQQGTKWTVHHLARVAVSKNLAKWAYLIGQGCQWDESTPLETSAICTKYLLAHQTGLNLTLAPQRPQIGVRSRPIRQVVPIRRSDKE